MTSQEDLLEIIEELRSSNSKLFKEALLRDHSDNQEWKDYLVEVYNPFITYGESGDKNYNQDNLTNLKLCRSLNAGITAVTINKAYPGLIPTASKMNKAYDYGKKAKELGFPLYAGLKYDGNYVNIITTEASVEFYTSGGHQYVHDNHDLDLPVGFVYMAERIHGLGKLGDRRGCALEGPKGAKFAKEANTYKIFDCVTLADFTEGISVAKYRDRQHLVPAAHKGEEKIFYNLEELEEWLDRLVDQGYEGIVMKQPDWFWKDTKSRKVEFAKWKKIPTADLVCVEEFEGEGNARGFLGSIRLRDSLGRYVNVGSGLARDIPYPCGSFVDRVVEISYEHINPKGTYIQPRVEGIREDKGIDDID